MSFQVITQSYQELLEEFKTAPITEEVMDEIRDILCDYCTEVEFVYGVDMTFHVWVAPKEEGGKLKYKVEPTSDLDAVLLKHVVENAAFVGYGSKNLQ